MSIWSLIEGGMSFPANDTFGQRLSGRVGRLLAQWRRGVSIHPSARISPDARICARGQAIHIGAQSIISQGAMIQGNVTLGKNCSMQPYAILTGYADGGITIGNNVRIAPHVTIISGNHRFADTTRPICAQGVEAKPVVVEDDVWIAGRVNIMAGVTVGHGSVIAAGAVVTHDVPPMSVIAGVPARVIKTRIAGTGLT